MLVDITDAATRNAIHRRFSLSVVSEFADAGYLPGNHGRLAQRGTGAICQRSKCCFQRHDMSDRNMSPHDPDLFVVIFHGPPGIQIEEMETLIMNAIERTPWKNVSYSVQRIDLIT